MDNKNQNKITKEDLENRNKEILRPNQIKIDKFFK
jgi:hypothetical protein